MWVLYIASASLLLRAAEGGQEGMLRVSQQALVDLRRQFRAAQ
jgi:hypothetical protein